MAKETGISWADATFNPWWGCERVSPGCAHCYADTFARRVGQTDLWSKGGGHGFRFFSDKHWDEPLKWARTLPARLGRRPRVFCASMADVFEPADELLEPRARLFDLIEATPELDWLVLTKRPEEALTWNYRRWHSVALGPFPPNVWLGTSIENPRYTWRATVLRQIPAAVRFVSAEPLLGSLFHDRNGEPFSAFVPAEGDYRRPLNLDGIHWLIVGGESGGRSARPMHPEWARELRDAAISRGIAFHFKQWGSWGPAGAGVYPTDLCWSLGPGGMKFEADDAYVCAPNESDGEWLRYYGTRPTSAGHLLDGVEHREFPTPVGIAA